MRREGFALWALGFRPFYLLGAGYAAFAVVLWVAQFSGLLPVEAFRSPSWHGHEMLFGFALAIVSGFLLTAVRNWTQQPTPTGGTLAALAALWVSGRVLAYAPWPVAAAVVNAAFPFAIAAAIAVPLVRSGNRRNYFFVALLVAASAAAAMVHLSQAGHVALSPRIGLQAGLDLVLFMVAVIGGRVLPMFTNNGVPGAGATRHPWVERASLGGVLALLAAGIAQLDGAMLAILAMLVAIAHAIRLALWRPWRVLRNPLVWILHAAYAWIPVYLVLRALGAAGVIAAPFATHALTLGVIGGMTLGMMTRTAKGHTGRRLEADGFEVAAYALVMAAAVARVFGGLMLPGLYMQTVYVAATCWSAAFAIYAFRYWPILTSPRVDAHPG